MVDYKVAVRVTPDLFSRMLLGLLVSPLAQLGIIAIVFPN